MTPIRNVIEHLRELSQSGRQSTNPNKKTLVRVTWAKVLILIMASGFYPWAVIAQGYFVLSCPCSTGVVPVNAAAHGCCFTALIPNQRFTMIVFMFLTLMLNKSKFQRMELHHRSLGYLFCLFRQWAKRDSTSPLWYKSLQVIYAAQIFFAREIRNYFLFSAGVCLTPLVYHKFSLCQVVSGTFLVQLR